MTLRSSGFQPRCWRVIKPLPAQEALGRQEEGKDCAESGSPGIISLNPKLPSAPGSSTSPVSTALYPILTELGSISPI